MSFAPSRALAIVTVLAGGLTTPSLLSARQAPAAAPPQVRAAPLPPQVQAAPIQSSMYSPQLGAWYQLVPYGTAMAARLVAPPVAGSPLNQPQAQLETGDTITALDGQAIRTPADVENHYAQTSVTFINVRTGFLETRWVTLAGTLPGPGPGPGPGPFPPPTQRMLGVIGVTDVLPIVGIGGPAGYPGLRITSIVPGSPAANAGIVPGEIISSINGQRITSLDDVRQAVAYSGPVCQVQLYWSNGSSRTVSAYLGGYPQPAAATAPAAGAPVAPGMAVPIPTAPAPTAPPAVQPGGPGVLPVPVLPLPGIPR